MSLNQKEKFKEKLNDCKLQLSFSNLLIPSFPSNKCQIELNYNNSSYRISYPQTKPFIMKFINPLSEKGNKITFSILLYEDNKYIRIGKGDFYIYKKYFYSNNLSFQKWAYFLLNNNQLNLLGSHTDILKAEMSKGQIYIEGKLLDANFSDNDLNDQTKSLTELLKNVRKKKEKITQNVSEKYKNVIDGDKKILKNLKKLNTLNKKNYEENNNKNIKDENINNIINDNLSDVSLDENDNYKENNNINIDKFIERSNKFINELKILNTDLYIPNNIEEQRRIYFKILDESNNLSKEYDEQINNIKKVNKELKEKTKQIHLKYVLEKEKYNNEKKDFIKQSTSLNKELNTKKENKENLINDYDKILKKQQSINKKYNLSIIDIPDNKDIYIMIDILNTLKNSNLDITKKLTKNEAFELKEILKKRDKTYSNDKNGNENENEEYENDPIVKTIEEIVNRNYSMNLIPMIKIEQIDNNNYLFDNKKVCLDFDVQNKTQLKTNEGKDFELWLIKNFSIKK